MTVCNCSNNETKRREIVRRDERVGIAEIDFVLAPRNLMMTGLDFEPHVLEIVNDETTNGLRFVHGSHIEVAARIVRLE